MGAERAEYVLAGSYVEFVEWVCEDPRRTRVTYLTPERAERLVASGAPRGILHRVGAWESSPARAAAERLEG